jgi:hypothetical protein
LSLLAIVRQEAFIALIPRVHYKRRRVIVSEWLGCNNYGVQFVHDNLKLGILIFAISGCDTDFGQLDDSVTIETIECVYGYNIAISG